MKNVIFVVSIGVGLAVAAPARAQFDDFVLSYDARYVPRASIEGRMQNLDYLRQNLRAELGLGAFGFGLQFQDARAVGRRGSAVDEAGTMLTLRFSPELTDFLRLEALGRVGLTHQVSDPNQALFATETDLALKLVAFDREGIGPAGRALFTSGHVGIDVNWVGKLQIISGVGIWWRQLGLYGTGFWTLVGVEPSERDGWARVDDAGVSFALSWDIDLGDDEAVRFEFRQNVPFRNGGFDSVFAVRWNVPLLEPFVEEPAAW